ncbi:MAG: SIMPL domain-containing protein [Microvirga sp.]
MDGEGIIRVRPDAARIRVGVLNEGASPTEVAQENATRMSSVVDAVKKTAGTLRTCPSSIARRSWPAAYYSGSGAIFQWH